MDGKPLCAIVGMGRGISYGVARRFASSGCAIAMVARDNGLLNSVAAELEAVGANARGFPADAGNETELRSALRQIANDLGPVEVLIYNASASHAGEATALAVEDAAADFRVNVLGAVIAAQEVVPRMRAAGRGTILLTGGGLALTPAPPLTSLSIGKAGLRNLAYSLADELTLAGIHVATVTICGFVQPGTHFSPEQIADVFWSLHQQSPGEFEREVIYK